MASLRSSPEKYAAAKILWATGEVPRIIARKVGVTVNQLCATARDYRQDFPARRIGSNGGAPRGQTKWAANPEMYAKAKYLYNDRGFSYRETADELGITEGAFGGVAKRNRADFPARGNPVAPRQYASERERVEAARVSHGMRPIPMPGASTLPPLVTTTLPILTIQIVPATEQEDEMATKTKVYAPPVPRKAGSGLTCQYIAGNDRKTWTMCGRPATWSWHGLERVQSPYCATHCALCYQGWREAG